MKTLPEKWFIKLTEENRTVLLNWKNQQPNVDADYIAGETWCIRSIPGSDRSYMDSMSDGSLAKSQGCEEITFEEFKWWLLGEFPEFWQIERDVDNYITINEWMNKFHCINGSSQEYSADHGLTNNRNLNKDIDAHITTISFDEFKKYVLKETPVEGNKYGIEVGDTIKIISEFEVIEVTNKGIRLNSSYSWMFTNKWLDNKNWTLIKNKSKMYNLKELLSPEIIVFIETGEQWEKLESTGLFNLCEFYGNHYYYLNKGTWNRTPNKTDIVVQFNQIKFKEMEKKNIIGYKVPFDMFEGIIKKDTVYFYRGNFNDFVPKHESCPNNKAPIVYTLPKEIVEQWEPVYETVLEFKIGDWLSFKSEMDNKVYTSKLKEWTSHAYCILENGTQPFKHLIYLSTPKEIKEYENNLLLEEAKKRYPIGTKFKTARGTHVEYKVINLSSFRIQSDGAICIEGAGCGTVYFQGTWAEILPSFPQIEINGYKAEFCNDHVKFGCANIDKNIFIAMTKIGKTNFDISNREVESITIGKGIFSKEIIKQIAQYYLEK